MFLAGSRFILFSVAYGVADVFLHFPFSSFKLTANDTNNSAFTVSSFKCKMPEDTVILRKCMFHTNSSFFSLSFQNTPARLIICEMSQFGL